MEAPQRLHRPDVGGCGRCIARYDQPVPDECLTEEAHDYDDQVQHAADSCVKLWRCFNGAFCHLCFSRILQPLLIHCAPHGASSYTGASCANRALSRRRCAKRNASLKPRSVPTVSPTLPVKPRSKKIFPSLS